MIRRVKGKPITAGRTEYSKRPPMLQNQNDTSAQAERLIKQPPMPFKSSSSPAQIPVQTNPYYRASADFEKDALRYGGTGKTVSVKNAPTVNYGAVGYDRGPYQNRSGLNSVNSGNPSGGNRQAGRIATNVGPQVSAKEVRRLKQTYPGLGIGRIAR